MSTPTRLSKLRAVDQPQLSRTQDSTARTLEPVAQAVGKTPLMGAAPPPWVNADVLSGFTWFTTGARPAHHVNALKYVYTRGFVLNSTGGLLSGVPVMRLPIGARPGVPILVPASAQGSISATGFNLTVSIDGLVTPDDVPNNDSFSWYFSFLAEA